MSRRLRKRLFRIFAAVIAVAAIWLIIQQSEAFTDCINSRKNTKQYQTLGEGRGVVGSSIIQTRLYYVCVWTFADKNSGALVGLATIALSVFTFTLWRATERLWKTSQIHSKHTERSDFVGVARYKDISGGGHETAICRIYAEGRKDRFERYGDAEYNHQT